MRPRTPRSRPMSASRMMACAWSSRFNMQVFHTVEEVAKNFGTTVASVGNFDGVHRAHQNVLAAIVQRAKQLDARSLVVTFDPHPTRVLRPDRAPKLITPLAPKLELISGFGVDAALALPF